MILPELAQNYVLKLLLVADMDEPLRRNRKPDQNFSLAELVRCEPNKGVAKQAKKLLDALSVPELF